MVWCPTSASTGISSIATTTTRTPSTVLHPRYRKHCKRLDLECSTPLEAEASQQDLELRSPALLSHDDPTEAHISCLTLRDRTFGSSVLGTPVPYVVRDVARHTVDEQNPVRLCRVWGFNRDHCDSMLELWSCKILLTHITLGRRKDPFTHI